MKRLDLLTALIVLISIVFFTNPDLIKKTNKVGLTSVTVFEGAELLNGGRNGTAQVSFFNPTNDILECEVKIDISQFFSGTLFSDVIQTSFSPNTTIMNFSITLPNGKNKVTIDATC
ncbi:MAG: hypothetical protein GOU98_03860 [Candidatus Altiarchaeota archaeon]|nr:hypothetical protein [Candidatus Altiarchaeota archaeon]